MTEKDWGLQAGDLLEEALYELRSGGDAIVTVDHALACLRVEAGELDADEVTPAGRICTCPPDLRARGGWSSACPVAH